jgi:hypothetical protein
MPSLSSYDIGKRSFEGRRYAADLEAANEALRLFHRCLETDPSYRPELVWCVGNHEDRISRAINDMPHLEGWMGLDDLDFKRRGWRVVPFREHTTIDGVTYSHYFQGGNSAMPIAGEYAAANLVRKKLVSSVAGHSHLLDYARRVDGRGRVVQGLVVGCYFEDWEAYAGQSNANWWRGLCVLRSVVDGDYDLETWSMGRIRQTWG